MELTEPAEVKFNDTELAWKNAFAYYEKEYAGTTVSGVFEYTDLDNETFTNSVILKNEIAIPASLTSISQGTSYELSWDGNLLEEGESVVVTIDWIHENDTQVFTTDADGATSIIFSKSQLGNLGDGPATIYMERWQHQDLQEGTEVGGAVWYRYIAEKKSISITE